MSWDIKLNHMLSKFDFTFTWDYNGDGELRSSLPDVFRVLDQGDERSLEQILIGCVHQENPSLTFTQPRDNPDIPYEMKFIVHPPHEPFAITKIVLLSEARNLELYINGGYEKSTRGIMLTINKERKLSLFEAQFDLSGYVETKSNATIKFLSHPCKDHMKLQAIVTKVEKCKPLSSMEDDQAGGPVNLSNVKRFLGSVGRPLSNDAQRMLQSIENYQQSPVFKAQQMLSSQATLLQNIARSRETEARRESLLQQVDEKEFLDEERRRNFQADEVKPPIGMLTELSVKDKSNIDQQYPQTDTISSPQARWPAHLQPKARANKTTSPQSPPVHVIPGTTSVDGYSGSSEEHGSQRTRQRPSSVGCVSEGGLDRSFNPELLREKWLKEGGHSQRCETCGCPGCVSVFASISANIFATEKRILDKVDGKITQLREDLNTKFELLYELLEGLLDREQGINDQKS